MAEYRPDANELLATAKSNIEMVRRIALAAGAAMLAFGLGRCFHGGFMDAGCAALGAAVVGFFAPTWPAQHA
jgi:hypothetical protein